MKRRITAVAIGMFFLVIACSDDGSLQTPNLNTGCLEGEVLEAGQCVPVEQLPVCPAGQVVDAQGVCAACPAGQVINAQGACAVEGQVCTFSDSNLAAAVRLSLGLPANADIPKASCAALTTLNASAAAATPADKKIVSLAGLEQCVLLKTLNLKGNAISDLTPLASLSPLENLDLSSNVVVQLSPLRNPNLKVLKLAGNRIQDIAALSGFGVLTELDVSRNEISDINALEPMSSLRILNLASNRIASIQPLCHLWEDNEGLPAGSSVDIRVNPVTSAWTIVERVCRDHLIGADVHLLY